MRFHGNRVVSRACVSGVTPPKPRDISSWITTTRRTNQICCSRDRNRSCRRAGRARACSRKDRRGVGSITLNTITTAHFVSIRDVTAAKTRLGSSNRGAPSALSLTCCPCSRDLSCRRASRSCARAPCAGMSARRRDRAWCGRNLSFHVDLGLGRKRSGQISNSD